MREKMLFLFGHLGNKGVHIAVNPNSNVSFISKGLLSSFGPNFFDRKRYNNEKTKVVLVIDLLDKENLPVHLSKKFEIVDSDDCDFEICVGIDFLLSDNFCGVSNNEIKIRSNSGCIMYLPLLLGPLPWLLTKL